MKVALYARVSTERQAERGTIGSQLAVLREQVTAAGHELVSEYIDDGHSGARLDRPGLDALRDAAEAGLFEAVWCLSPDRLARAYAYQVLVLDELGRLGVKVHFTDAPDLSADDPQAVLLTQVQGVIAEYEKAKIAERYRRGKVFRARAGEITSWKASYGYRRVVRSAAGPAHLQIYEPEAAVVRGIFTERAAGTTVREICRQPQRRWHRLADRQADLGTLHHLPAAAQRSLRRPCLLQPHRNRRRRRAGAAHPAGRPPARGVDPDRLPGDRHRREVSGSRPGRLRQQPVEPAPRRARCLAAQGPGQMRRLPSGHQLSQDARPQRHLAPLLLLPQPRPATRRRTRPSLPRTQHPRRRAR